MPIFKRKKKQEPVEPAVLDYKTAHKLAMILEKAKLGDYVQMMSKPWRSIYLNFLAGIARGAGMVVGASLVGGLLVIFTVQGLKYVAKHSDMVPWFGGQVKEAVGFVLNAADEKLADMDEAMDPEEADSSARSRPQGAR